MGTKLIFRCNNCGADGTIKVKDDCHSIEICPCCGATLDVEQDDEDEE